jgi:hypothetical protein
VRGYLGGNTNNVWISIFKISRLKFCKQAPVRRSISVFIPVHTTCFLKLYFPDPFSQSISSLRSHQTVSTRWYFRRSLISPLFENYSLTMAMKCEGDGNILVHEEHKLPFQVGNQPELPPILSLQYTSSERNNGSCC